MLQGPGHLSVKFKSNGFVVPGCVARATLGFPGFLVLLTLLPRSAVKQPATDIPDLSLSKFVVAQQSMEFINQKPRCFLLSLKEMHSNQILLLFPNQWLPTKDFLPVGSLLANLESVCKQVGRKKLSIYINYVSCWENEPAIRGLRTCYTWLRLHEEETYCLNPGSWGVRRTLETKLISVIRIHLLMYLLYFCLMDMGLSEKKFGQVRGLDRDIYFRSPQPSCGQYSAQFIRPSWFPQPLTFLSDFLSLRVDTDETRWNKTCERCDFHRQ